MIEVRQGRESDIPHLCQLIKELADYERAAEEAVLSEQQLLYDFVMRQAFRFMVAVLNDEVVGIALYYPKYSTWKGSCLFLEDIIVKEAFRRKGIGNVLFRQIMQIAIKENAARLEWQVLNWNEPAISFYRKFSTILDPEWINCKLTSEMITTYLKHEGI